jgi:hypothetical protein
VPAEPFSDEWWTKRLYQALRDRRPVVERAIRYYDGEFPDPWLPEQAQMEFQRVLALSKSNYMGLVVDATAERMTVVGFKRGGAIDLDAWEMYKANKLVRFGSQAIKEAVKTSVSYLLVAPNSEDGAPPRITVEHPVQVIVERDPADPTRVEAALKCWFDDRVGLTMATLYLADRIVKWQGPRRSVTERWEPRRVDGEDWPAENPLGRVPIVEMPNNPDLFGVGRPEIADVTYAQDRINKTIVDRLMTQDYGAFPQKWATGLPDDDEDKANRLPGEKQLDIGQDRLVAAKGSGSENVKFGQFAAAALDPYSRAKQEDVKDIAARTRVPSQYLLGEMVNLAAEALKAAESGLVAKVMERREPYGDAFEEAMRLAFLAAGDTERAADMSTETVWRNPEFRTEGQMVDALVKMKGLGVPEEALWERWGATPTEIEQWKQMQLDQTQRTLGADVASLLAGPKPLMDVEELERRSEVYGQLIRAGVEPVSAAEQAGLSGLEHTGERPVTLREGEAA